MDKNKFNSVLSVLIDVQSEIESFLNKYDISLAYKDLVDLICFCDEKKIIFEKLISGGFKDE